MLILSLDTSSDICSAALFDGTRELSTLLFRHDRRLSERLSGIIDFLMADRAIALRDIEAFAVGLGPGSFTGVRIGVTLAKTFAHALARPIVGISSLDAIAEATPAFPGAGIAAVAPTRRTEVVAAFYASGSTVPVAQPAVEPNTEVVARARALLNLTAGDPLLVCGEAAGAIERDTPADQIANVKFLTNPVSAASVARLAAARLELGDVDDAYTLAPLYVTPTPVG